MSYVSPHGVSSIFRLPKLAAYFYQSQRDPQKYGPMVHICNYWTPQSPTRVLVVSNCEEVALYQDGVLISKKTPEVFTSLPHPCFQWVGVPFKAGELKALGYINGKEVVTHVVRTPGNPAKLTVVPDTNVLYTGGDMTRVVVSLVDQNDQLLHLRADSVSLSASGAGEFIGEARTALEGGQMAFYVKTRAWQTGAITCQATSAGLSASETILVTNDSLYTPVFQQKVMTNSKGIPKKSRWYTIYGKRIQIPNGVQGNALVSIFDCRGMLVYKGNIRAVAALNFKDAAIASGVHLMQIMEE